jgi:tRNA G26 N,N-dimethylase Trm1
MVQSSPSLTPRLREVLTDVRLPAVAKVIYTFLDELSQGLPLVISQIQIASELSLTTKTVTTRISDLRRLGYMHVSTHFDELGHRVNTYRTRYEDDTLVPLVYS